MAGVIQCFCIVLGFVEIVEFLQLIKFFGRVHKPIFIAYIMEEALRSQSTTNHKGEKPVASGYDSSEMILKVIEGNDVVVS
jgi:hypothetical protein